MEKDVLNAKEEDMVREDIVATVELIKLLETKGFTKRTESKIYKVISKSKDNVYLHRETVLKVLSIMKKNIKEKEIMQQIRKIG